MKTGGETTLRNELKEGGGPAEAETKETGQLGGCGRLIEDLKNIEDLFGVARYTQSDLESRL